MTESTLSLAPAEPNLLAALRAVAPSEYQAKSAFELWAAAQVLGWEQTRQVRGQAKWYRDARLLERAGVAAPVRAWKDRRADQAGHVRTTLADLYALVGRPFAVADPWDPEFYPEGTTGHVSALLFRDTVWCFELAYDGSPGGHDQIPVEQVLSRCTFSEGGPDAA